MQQEAELGGWHSSRLRHVRLLLRIDLLAKLWLRERQLSRVYLERQMNRSHVAKEMGGICI